MSKGYFLISGFLALVFLEHAFAEVRGIYTDALKELIRSGNYQKLINAPMAGASGGKDLVELNCVETPGQRFYIGVSQRMEIKAPLADVAHVIEDIEHYAELFPGYAEVKVVSRSDHQIVTAWEQKIPVFFIPNVKYQMIYTLSRPDPQTFVYQYQLSESGTIKESDGFIILQKQSETVTRYLEIDFFKADWGVLETLAPGKIWPESVDGLYISDVAIKLKAETPELSSKRAREGAESAKLDVEKRLKSSPGEICANGRAHLLVQTSVKTGEAFLLTH